MNIFSYKTITGPSESLVKEKGSRFIGLAFPVSDEENIKKILKDLRKKYSDARHHCYAWRLNPEGSNFRANDDQEPSGTAGKPILGQLISFDLTNTLVVVIRYFGGTLLGTGGLIQAYKLAAHEALQSAVVIEKPVVKEINIRFSYEVLSEIMRLIKSEDITVISQQQETDCLFHLEVPLRNFSGVLNFLDNLGIKKLEVNNKGSFQ